MRVMKDSGIAWIGEIPENWKMVQVRYLFRIGRGRVISQTELQDNGIYPVFSSQTKDNGCLGYINTYDFDISQLTWTTDGANAGTVFLRSGKHNCTNVCGTLQPLNAEIDLRFQKYALEHIAYYHKRADTNGFKIMNNEMANIYTILPPLNTQRRIADYLDRKCSQIDAIIARQQEVIEKLKAYKLSVITEAVTKGLNPHVPMKDSGVEWIGEIPEHWKIGKLCFFTVRIGDGLHGTPEFDDKGEYYFINGNNLGATYITIKENTKTVALSEYNKYFIALDENTLLISLNGTIGSVSQYHGEQIILGKSAGYIIIDSCRDLTLDYLRFYLQSKSVKTLFELSFAGTTINNLSLETLRNLPVCIMTSEEQLQISKVLDKKCLEIESTIQKKQILIERLAGYKKSLIYEVVTGKKEV